MSVSLITNPRDIDISLDDEGDDDHVTREETHAEQDENAVPNSMLAGGKKPKTVSNATLAALATRHTESSKQKNNTTPGKKLAIPVDEEAERLHRAAVLSKSGVEAGKRLYIHAKFHEKKKQELALKEQEKKDIKAVADCTFKPSLSSGTVDVMRSDPMYKAPSDRFNAMEQRKARSLLEKAHAEHVRQMKECTFRPSVTSASVALVQRARSSSATRSRSVGERLHQESDLRAVRRKVLEDHIKDSERQEVIGGFEMPVKQCQHAAERLVHWQQQRNRNIELLKEEQLRQQMLREAADDPATTADLQAVLHRLASGKKCEGAQGDVDHASGPRVSARTELLAEQLRELRFRALFCKYASAGCDHVSLGSVERQVTTLFPHDEGIPKALRLRLGPSATAEIAITRELFVQSLVQFEKKYGPQKWGRLENGSAAVQAEAEAKAKFHPIISKRTIDIAAKRRPQSADGTRRSIQEVLVAQGRLRDERLESARKCASDKVSEQCSFRPHINSTPPRRRASPAGRRGSDNLSARFSSATGSSTPDILDEIHNRLSAASTPVAVVHSPLAVVSPLSPVNTPQRQQKVPAFGSGRKTPVRSAPSSATKSSRRTPAKPNAFVDAAADEFAAIYRSVASAAASSRNHQTKKKAKPFR